MNTSVLLILIAIPLWYVTVFIRWVCARRGEVYEPLELFSKEEIQSYSKYFEGYLWFETSHADKPIRIPLFGVVFYFKSYHRCGLTPVAYARRNGDFVFLFRDSIVSIKPSKLRITVYGDKRDALMLKECFLRMGV